MKEEVKVQLLTHFILSDQVHELQHEELVIVSRVLATLNKLKDMPHRLICI